MALNLIVLGPPGAGKGTQAERLAAAWKIPKVSSGDMLRSAVQAGTEVGKRAKVMERGDFVADDVMIQVIGERLAQPDAANGFVLDGFPRTVAQGMALEGLMNAHDPLVIVDIEVPDEELVRRLLLRMVCTKCASNADPGSDPKQPCKRCGGPLGQRADDNETTVRERLRIFHRDTRPLVDYYRERPTFRTVDGARGPDQVTDDLTMAIEDVLEELKTASRGATP